MRASVAEVTPYAPAVTNRMSFRTPSCGYTHPMPRAAKARPRANGAPRGAPPPVELVLYISPSSRYALTAQRNCEELLSRFDPTRVHLEICDVSQYPERAEQDAICYTPALVKQYPLPRTFVIGDLSNTAAVVALFESCGLDALR